MINSMTVPGIIINDKGVIQAFNKSAEELLGYALIEVVGRNVNMLMNDQDAAKHEEYLASYLTTGQAKVIGKERVLMAKHKSGQAIEIQLSVTEQSDNGKKVITLFLLCLVLLIINIVIYFSFFSQLFVGMMHQSSAALEKARKTRKLKKESSKSSPTKSGASSSSGGGGTGAGTSGGSSVSGAAPAPEKK